MADLGSSHWLVSPDHEIEQKWIDVQIQEKKSRITRYKQDIEDLQKGKILDIECRISMLEKEVHFLSQKREGVEIAEEVK